MYHVVKSSLESLVGVERGPVGLGPLGPLGPREDCFESPTGSARELITNPFI